MIKCGDKFLVRQSFLVYGRVYEEGDVVTYIESADPFLPNDWYIVEEGRVPLPLTDTEIFIPFSSNIDNPPEPTCDCGAKYTSFPNVHIIGCPKGELEKLQISYKGEELI